MALLSLKIRDPKLREKIKEICAKGREGIIEGGTVEVLYHGGGVVNINSSSRGISFSHSTDPKGYRQLINAVIETYRKKRNLPEASMYDILKEQEATGRPIIL